MSIYKKTDNISYAIGAFVTFELINYKKEYVKEILISKSTKLELKNKIINLCKKNDIKYSYNDKTINKITSKKNVYIIGIFYKYNQNLSKENHIILDNPSNFGNLGTIFRSCIAFDFNNVALIGNSADYFNPQVIRASMGAIFHLNISQFKDINEYKKNYKNKLFSFMLNTDTKLNSIIKFKTPFSLIFGNEATGLDDQYKYISTPIKIESSSRVDSLNITSAVSIALYESYIKNKKEAVEKK